MHAYVDPTVWLLLSFNSSTLSGIFLTCPLPPPCHTPCLWPPLCTSYDIASRHFKTEILQLLCCNVLGVGADWLVQSWVEPSQTLDSCLLGSTPDWWRWSLVIWVDSWGSAVHKWMYGLRQCSIVKVVVYFVVPETSKTNEPSSYDARKVLLE